MRESHMFHPPAEAYAGGKTQTLHITNVRRLVESLNSNVR